jgi:DHA1 family tetracycline resistance protein-like MFS transporter
MPEVSRATKTAFTVVLIAVLLDSVSFSMVMPVMPALITQLTGEGLSQAAVVGGWLLTVFAITQFVCAPLLGGLSDRYGRRPVLLLSLLMFGVDYLIMGLAPTLALLFVGRILSGIPGASFIPAYAYTADVSTNENRTKNFALVGSAFSTGFVIGPALGGLLGTFGARAPFFAAAAVAFANFAIGYFALRESLPQERRRPFSWKRANPVGSLLQLRKFPQVFALAFALTLWFTAIMSYPTTWAFYTMFRFGWTEAVIGLSLAAYGAMIAFSQARLTGPVLARLGESRTVMYGLLLGALAFFGQGLATEGWMMFAFVPVWLIAAIAMPTISAMMSKQIPMDAQGELQGASASLMSVSAIVGPPIMAGLFGTFSRADAPVYLPGVAFIAAGLLTVLAASIVFRALRTSSLLAPAAAQAGASAMVAGGKQ